MKKLYAAIAVGATLLGGVFTAGSATATTAETASPQTVLVGGRCADYGTVRVNTSAVYVYTGAGTEYRRVKVLYRGDHVSCWPIIVGNVYHLCFDGPANGWIPVDINYDAVRDGYVPSTCVTD